MSTLGYRLARLSLLALATTWILTCPVLADTGDKPVKLVVIVPEDATVYIDGTKTTSTGTRRTFESPPVAVSKKYSYMIKAVWTGADGKEVVHEKKFPVKPGETNEIDLTKRETTKAAPPAPKAKLTVEGPGPVEINAGGTKTITIKIKRENFKGPVKVFGGGSEGPKPLTIPEDKTEGPGVLEVPGDSKPGPRKITVYAKADKLEAKTEFKLTVKAAPPAPLTLETPAAVDVEAGGKKVFEVKVKREDFKGPVKVMFEGLPAGVKIGDTTIPAEASTAMVEVAAAKDAKVGPTDVVAKADGNVAKAETKFKLNVKAAPKDEKDKDKDKDKDAKGKDKEKDKGK
jgi:uncharacterized protein (TIGR03000 family)